VHVYVGNILSYFGFVLVWLILLLIFVVRTSASDCLEDHLRNDLSSGTLNHTHSLTHYLQANFNFSTYCISGERKMIMITSYQRSVFI